MTIFRFTLLRSRRRTTDLLLFVALPVGLLLLPATDTSILPLGLQLFIFVIFYFSARMAHLLMDDRQSGLLTRIAAAPITQLGYLVQHLLAFMLLLLAQAAVMVAVSVWLHGPRIPSPPLVLLLYSGFALSTLSFSLAWCSLFRNREASFLILFNVFFLMAIVGGMLWPIALLPLTLQRVAMLLPTYWLSEGLSQLATDTVSVWLPLCAMILFAALCLLIGSRWRVH